MISSTGPKNVLVATLLAALANRVTLYRVLGGDLNWRSTMRAREQCVNPVAG